MSLSVNLLATIAIELQQGISHQDRFQRLISTLRHVLKCDASALLRYEAQHFRPLAIDDIIPQLSVGHYLAQSDSLKQRQNVPHNQGLCACETGARTE